MSWFCSRVVSNVTTFLPQFISIHLYLRFCGDNFNEQFSWYSEIKYDKLLITYELFNGNRVVYGQTDIFLHLII